MDIGMENIKKLRDATGVSVMQCKKALEDAGGNMEQAIIMLRKKGAEIAAKKSDRSLGSSAISTYLHSNALVGTMVELSSETDFVSGNGEFRALAHDIAMHVAANNPEFLSVADITEDAKKNATEVFQKEVADKPEAMRAKILEGKLKAYFSERVLLEQPFVKNPDITIGGLIQDAIQKFGEKVEIVRFVRFKSMER